MSKAKNDIPRAAIHVGAPAKSFSLAEGNEPERREWDETTYRLKNQDKNNHYDFSRKQLNFEINSKGQIVPLGSNPVPLHERLKQRLDELGFKPYKDKNNPLGNPDNSPNCTVGIIVSGDHDVLARLAFGDQDVDYTIRRSNAGIRLQQGIKDWAMDTYQWACRRWGAENIIAFDVHNDETTPHIHIQTIPVARTKARGRASVKYVHKDDKAKVLTQKEWKKLSEEIRRDYARTEVERKEKECVSYARVWGEDKYAVGRTYYRMHTDYYNEVGRKYGLERGEDIAMLPGEERRKRVHKSKAVLEAERQAKEAVAKAQSEAKQLEGKKAQMEGEVQSIQQQKVKLEEDVSRLEGQAAALDIKGVDLAVPSIETHPLVKKAYEAIKAELEIPIPTFGQKEWRKERRKAVKEILTNLQDNLIAANNAQKKDIVKLGESLYKKAMQDAKAIVEQNKQLQKANEQLANENKHLKEKISTIDDTAISNLRNEKNAEIEKLNKRLQSAGAESVREYNRANMEHNRAEKAENLIKEMMEVPEIRKIWDSIQQNKKAFLKQLDQWINDALAAIKTYTKDYEHYDFPPEQRNTIKMGIIAEAFKQGLDSTDSNQRMAATHSLLDRMDWTGATQHKANLTAIRTEQLCEEMTVAKELVMGLFLMAGGRCDVAIGTGGGGGSSSELTTWDGKKKRNGWGR